MATITPSASTLGLMIFSGTNYAGMDEGGYFYIWGAQLEQQSYATSYIPTSGASATRNQELCNNATPVINSEEGTLYAEIAALANDGTYRGIAISDGTTQNRVVIFLWNSSNTIYTRVNSNGTIVYGSGYVVSSITDSYKIAISYSQDLFKVFVNGIKVATDTSGNTPNNLSKLAFDDGGGSAKFFGNTKDLQVYTKALSDAELIKLTT